MTAKDTIIEKILTDLPIASCRGEMTKEEWRGWFEEAFEKGEKYASQSKWVSCAERLPESGENILICHREYGIGIGYYIPLDGSFAGTFHGVPIIDENKQVSHWQHIDKPVEK